MSNDKVAALSLYQGAYRKDLDEPVVPETPAPQLDAADQVVPETPPVTVEEDVYKKRYDGLKAVYDRNINEARNETKKLLARVEELERQIANPASGALPVTPEAIAQWREQFPDVYDMIVTVADQRAETRITDKTKVLEEQVKSLQSETLVTRRQRAYAELKLLHPDIDELRQNPDFHEWGQRQPKQIQDWLYNNNDDPVLCSKAIDLYKSENGISKKAPAKPAPSREADAARLVNSKTAVTEPSGTGPKIWTWKEVDALRPDQFEKYEAEIMEQHRKGLIK